MRIYFRIVLFQLSVPFFSLVEPRTVVSITQTQTQTHKSFYPNSRFLKTGSWFLLDQLRPSIQGFHWPSGPLPQNCYIVKEKSKFCRLVQSNNTQDTEKQQPHIHHKKCINICTRNRNYIATQLSSDLNSKKPFSMRQYCINYSLNNYFDTYRPHPKNTALYISINTIVYRELRINFCHNNNRLTEGERKGEIREKCTQLRHNRHLLMMMMMMMMLRSSPIMIYKQLIRLYVSSNNNQKPHQTNKRNEYVHR